MHWWEVVLTNLATLSAGVIGGGWYAKKKALADAEGTEVDNLKEIITTWREAYNDLKVQREEFNQLWLDLQKENIEMRQELTDLKQKVRDLQCENGKLRKEIDKLKV
ncbi:MAG: hypothetical protein K0B15_12290 [Lentimicrobium sp.]|nr:hypothetical protein [Lentimicrobium sp.]